MSANLQPIEPQVITPEIIPSEIAFPLSADRKALFFRSLIATGGHVSKACELANVSRQRVLQWRSEDVAFARDYDDALEYGTENLEERLYERGMNTDTTAAIFLLKARRPEKYRENIKLETETTLSDASIDRLGATLLTNLLAAAEARRRELSAASETAQLPATVADAAADVPRETVSTPDIDTPKAPALPSFITID